MERSALFAKAGGCVYSIPDARMEWMHGATCAARGESLMSVKQDDFTGSHRYNRPKYFGAAVKRTEDPALVTGRGHFVDDIRLPGTLHAAFVRSAHAHAKIRGIDASAARALPGVHLVLTYADLPEPAQKPLT